MASRGGEAQRLCKRDQPINAYVWIDIYVWVIGSKTPCEKEMLTEKLQIDTDSGGDKGGEQGPGPP